MHYGLYLAAACPLLALVRLFGPQPLRRLGRLALTGVVALALMAPGLWLLLEGTAQTPYQQDDSSLLQSGENLLRPVDADSVQRFLENYDPRFGGQADPPMGTPRDRLLTAISRSQTAREFYSPGEKFPGRTSYWWLAALALACASRRRLALVAALDVAVLSLYALGPFLKLADRVVMLPLPYYLDFLLIPGFEQLKQLNRFALLAAVLAGVPLALGLEGALQRLGGWRPALKRLRSPWVQLPLVAAICFGLVGVRTAGVAWGIWPPTLYYARADTTDLVVPHFPLPAVAPFPFPEALRELEPAGALALPLAEPTPAVASVNAMRAGLSLVNDPPYGAPRERAMPFWFESNALLNQAALISGSDRPNSYLPLGDPQAVLDELRAEGLRYVLLFREALPGPELVPGTEALLDAHLQRVADDGQVAVWEVPGSGG